jgi:L-cysteine desulfidase
VALACAVARDALGCAPDSVEVFASPAILKNGMCAGVPGTGMAGLRIAAALGALRGGAEMGLTLLEGVTPEDALAARAFAEDSLVKIASAEDTARLYIESVLRAGEGLARCVIMNRHDNIAYLEADGIVKLDRRDTCEDGPSGANVGEEMTVREIWDFAQSVEAQQLDFLKEVSRMNRAIAEEGLQGSYGMNVGRRLIGRREDSGMFDYAVGLTAAGVDARMAGAAMPVMTSSGSGNQGLTATLPILAVAERTGASEEAALRALALSHLISIHVKRSIGRLSALCGCAISASVGAASGVAMLLGGNLPEVVSVIRNMIADISGLICDGAKPNCALKIATSVSGAMQCVRLAMDSAYTGDSGIVERDIERTIQNLGRLGSEGMGAADGVILDIMTRSDKTGY